MYEQLSFLGIRLGEQRRRRGLTLRELATRTGLSAGLLSKIENFRTLPSLPVLLNIARELRMDPSELFSGIGNGNGEKPWLLVHPGEGVTVERESNHGLRYEMLLEGSVDASELQVMLVTVAPGARRKAVSGSGMELIRMLSGQLDYRIGADTLKIANGDTLLFDGTTPHLPVNNSDSDAVMLVCYFLHEEKASPRCRK